MNKDADWYWNQRFNEEQRQIQVYYEDIGYSALRPSNVYKPKLARDGNMWIALFGENLQVGVAGFGKSPELAMQDFDKNWNKEIE